MAHPYASQAKASQKRRLSALGAKAGKSFGSSSMYKASSYPSKGAGSSTPLTISGGTAKKRADRPANHFAGGGFVGGGTKKKSRKGHSTTNIVIASPGGGQAAAPPRPVPVPLPVPVGAGAPPVARPSIPPMGPSGAGIGGPPVNVNVPPPAAAPPLPMPGPRPPGMAGGGLIGSTYHNWGKGYRDGGSVKKKANGGPIGRGGGRRRPPPDEEEDRPSINVPGLLGAGGGGGGGGGTAAAGVGDAGLGGGGSGLTDTALGGGGGGGGAAPDTAITVAAPVAAEPLDVGAGPGFKKGGTIKKRQMGGTAGAPAGLGPQGMQPRRKPFTPGAVPGQRPGAPGAGPPVVPLTGGRPTRPGYMKKGGEAKHEDEAQDKKLIAKMIKKSKKADGGRVKYYEDGDEVTPQSSSTSAPTSVDPKAGGLGGVMKALTGVDKALNPKSAGGGSNYAVNAAQGAQTAAEKAGQAVAGSTQALARNAAQGGGFKPGAVPGGGKNMFQLGAKDGGRIKGYKVGGDVTGEFSTKDQDKYGTSTFRGGKYENEPTVVKERTKGFNQPMGQDVSEDVAAEKRTRGTHYNKGGVVKRAGAGSGLGRLAASKRM